MTPSPFPLPRGARGNGVEKCRGMRYNLFEMRTILTEPNPKLRTPAKAVAEISDVVKKLTICYN